MSRPLKRGILGASTIILSKDIDKYAFMCGSIFYETDVSLWTAPNLISITLLSLVSIVRNSKRGRCGFSFLEYRVENQVIFNPLCAMC